jgi:pyruvate dehydrogenase E1 component alpha subunit
MKTKWTKEKLDAFSEEIAEIYKQGKIRAPIHLCGDNAAQLIEIFKQVKRTDFIFSTWRSGFHWLLSGRSEEELKKQILEGHSMHIYSDRFFTSSIVGGIAPIAVGVALALKMKKSKDRVWCFIGDAAFECGIVKESIRYSEGHDLPIKFIIENNGYSVRAKTQEVWGKHKNNKIIKYNYKRKYNHAGCALDGKTKYIMF